MGERLWRELMLSGSICARKKQDKLFLVPVFTPPNLKIYKY